jgi:isochorismate synthase
MPYTQVDLTLVRVASVGGHRGRTNEMDRHMTIDEGTDDVGRNVAVDDGVHLLHSYEAGSSFFFASPRGTLLARGVDATVPKTVCSLRRTSLAEWVGEFFDNARRFGRRSPIVVGAVPFDESLPAHLVLPGELVRSGPLIAKPGGAAEARREFTVRQTPGPREYERGVSRALRRLDRGDLQKVVLARSLELSATEPIDARRILRNLAVRNPGGYTFAVDLPRRGEDGSRDSFGPKPELERTLLGASPELLVSRHGTQVRCRPVEGSRPRAGDPVEDRVRAEALLSSDKDRRKHAVVVDAMAEALRPMCENLRIPETPSVLGTATMWQLVTEITADLRDSDTSSLELATALHPTPAVCGWPYEAARVTIAESEPFERGYYAGLVGWCDADGDGEWATAIRCAEIEDDSLRLYAGAGIVEGSDPADELAETSAKLRTALSALGLDEATV